MDSAVEVISFMPEDPAFREKLAVLAFQREVALIQAEPVQSRPRFVLTWQSLPDDKKRVYRTTVDVCMDAVIEAFELEGASS